MEVATESSKIMESHYPESLRRIFIVNGISLHFIQWISIRRVKFSSKDFHGGVLHVQAVYDSIDHRQIPHLWNRQGGVDQGPSWRYWSAPIAQTLGRYHDRSRWRSHVQLQSKHTTDHFANGRGVRSTQCSLPQFRLQCHVAFFLIKGNLTRLVSGVYGRWSAEILLPEQASSARRNEGPVTGQEKQEAVRVSSRGQFVSQVSLQKPLKSD